MSQLPIDITPGHRKCCRSSHVRYVTMAPLLRIRGAARAGTRAGGSSTGPAGAGPASRMPIETGTKNLMRATAPAWKNPRPHASAADRVHAAVHVHDLASRGREPVGQQGHAGARGRLRVG